VDFELDELKREFLTEAREKAREMEAKIEEGSKEALERLSYLAHQLKGSGGSYGFQRISESAAELEKAAETLTRGNNAGVQERIRKSMSSLLAEIEQRSRELAA
jgi:HPt (histidine-containing phosphotransfer) domain-containing protein